jgi:type II secretory pathway pseudopilin PulG
VKRTERGMALLIELLIVFSLMLVALAVAAPAYMKASEIKDEQSAGEQLAQLGASEVAMGQLYGEFVAPVNLEGTLASPITCANPFLLNGADTQAPKGYSLSFTGGAAQTGVSGCTSTGFATFTINLDPTNGSLASRHFFLDQTGIVRFTNDNRPATASDPVYPVATPSRGQVSLIIGTQQVSNPTNPTNPNNPVTPPIVVNDTIDTGVHGQLQIFGPNAWTCFPLASGMVEIVYSGGCTANQQLSGTVSLSNNVPVGSANGYSQFSVLIPTGGIAPYFDGNEMVGQMEVLRTVLYDLNTQTALATCDIVGASNGSVSTPDPNGTAPSSPNYNACSATLTSKPNPGDFLAFEAYTPYTGPGGGQTGSAEGPMGFDGIEVTVQ